MSKAGEVMRRNVEFCVPETRAPDMKYLMKKYNYDDLLVVDNMNEQHLIGVIHSSALSDDALKDVLHPFDVSAKSRMEKIPAIVTQNSTIEECLELMERNHMSLLPVIDNNGHCCGIVKREDLLRY